MTKGSLLVFDGLLFHSTGFNTSKSSRKSIVLGYRSIDELDKTPDTSRQILVSGNHIYRGNDRPCCVCVSTDANPTCRLVTEGTPLRRRSFIVSVGRTYLGTMLSGTVVRVGGSSMDRNDLRDVVLDSLRRLLDRLRSGRDSMERLLPSASLYPPGIVWTRHILQYDLWQRALRANDVGEVTESDVWLWGHYFGVSSGFAWPSTELQRRGNVGRYALYSAVDRVTRAVADTFCRAQDIPVSPKPASTYELEEGVASVLGAAAAACYPHLDEVRRATEILLKEVSQPAIPVGVFRRIAPAVHGKPALKTTRHTAVTRNAVYKSVHEARLRHLSTPAIHRRNALLPLWTPAEPAITEDIQVLLDELRHTHGTNDRQKVWKLLQDGHHLLLRQNVSQDEAIELLMLETAIMRDHFNISGMVVLDVLEHLLPMSDSRRVTIARERSHLLQVHHFHRSSLKWLQIANERMRTSLVRWASPDDRLIEAARNMERMTELAAEINALAPNSSRYDLHRLQMRTQSLLTRVDDADRVLEWRHIAERRVLDSTLWTKIADLQCGFDSRWDDEELVALDRVDQSVKRLGMPLREFAWSARRLVMLLAADRTSEFVSTARRTTQLAIEYGAAWPNQVARVEGALRVARSRRQRSWKQYMSELDELNALLPANTDLALRNPATLPRFVAIGRVPMG